MAEKAPSSGVTPRATPPVPARIDRLLAAKPAAPPLMPPIAPVVKSSGTAPVLKEIEAASKRVNELATDLSKRILTFEDWLNELPGKVSTTLWVYAPDDTFDQYQFGIHLGRSGKRWTLSYAFQQQCAPEQEFTDWKPLTEASIETKLHAAKFFPELLKKIVDEQERLAKTLSDAHVEFDAFAEEIGLSLKKGGK